MMNEDGPPHETCVRTKSSNSSGTSSIDETTGTSFPSINRFLMPEELASDATPYRSPCDTLEVDPKISDLMKADL
jgi:hypothetical protein